MEIKTCVKLAHVVAFLLLALYFKPLVARDLEVIVSDGLTEVMQLPMAKTIEAEAFRTLGQYFCKGKQTWPELVGKDGEEAKEIIEKENPNVETIVLPVKSPHTLDFRCNRVRVFVDEDNKVVRIPFVG